MHRERRRFGRAGFEVPALGLGCAGLGGDEVSDTDAAATVEAALAAGLDFLDTAPLYGESERRVGLALRGVARSAYRLSTKTGTHPSRRHDFSRDATLWSVDNSFKLLGVAYADVLLVHDPPGYDAMITALDTLEELKAQGVIGAIGLGQRTHDVHRRAIASGRFDVILTYHDLHPVRATARALVAEAHAADVGVINGSPLGLGLLVADLDDPSGHASWCPPDEIDRTRRFQAFCRARGLSIPGVALQFSLREPGVSVTLTGAKTPAELAQNLRGVATSLPEGLWAEMAAEGFTEG